MLPAASRLRRREDFSTVVRRGRRVSTGLVVVHGRSSQPPDPPRVGFIVSKAVGDAVTRNRVKRRLRHITADRLDLLPPGLDLVIRANPAAAQVSFARLEQAVTTGVDRLTAASAEKATAR